MLQLIALIRVVCNNCDQHCTAYDLLPVVADAGHYQPVFKYTHDKRAKQCRRDLARPAGEADSADNNSSDYVHFKTCIGVCITLAYTGTHDQAGKACHEASNNIGCTLDLFGLDAG